MKKRVKEVKSYRVSIHHGVKTFEIDRGDGYEAVSEKVFKRLTAAMTRRAKKAREEIAAAAVVADTGKLGQRNRPVARGKCWPLKSEALAVHPSQVEEANARNKRHGINVQYEPRWGAAIIPDEGEYKKLRKLEGVHHNNGYGS